jgi:hypothetical protein
MDMPPPAIPKKKANRKNARCLVIRYIAIEKDEKSQR